MIDASFFGPGSIARGLALVAASCVLVVGLRVALSGAEPAATAEADCDVPVEVATPVGDRLGCATEPALAPCGPLRAGDRVWEGDCRVEPGAMAAASRLLMGLPIDLNRANAEDLQLLQGIGPSKAAKLVEDRGRRGPFTTVDDLQRVSGFGPATVEKLRPMVTTEMPPPR